MASLLLAASRPLTRLDCSYANHCREAPAGTTYIVSARTRRSSVLACVVLLATSGGYAHQAPTAPPTRMQSPPTLQARPVDTTARRDSTLGAAASSRAESAYIAMLEKTNAQLSLWWNPYGVMIGALGVLFALGAIVVTFLLFRQSREYRKILDDSMAQHRKELDDSVAQYREVLNTLLEERLREMQTKNDAAIQTAQQQLLSAGDTEKQRLKTVIADLEKEKRELAVAVGRALATATAPLPTNAKQLAMATDPMKAHLQPGQLDPMSLLGRGLQTALNTRVVRCTNCGIVFPYKVPEGPGGILGNSVACPKCGQVTLI